jgi:hypothetical protein
MVADGPTWYNFSRTHFRLVKLYERVENHEDAYQNFALENHVADEIPCAA